MGSAPPTPSEDRVPAPRDSQGQVSSHSGGAQWENDPELLTVCTLLGQVSDVITVTNPTLCEQARCHLLPQSCRERGLPSPA